MRYLDAAIEHAFEQTLSQWRLLCFLKRSATLATVVTGLVLLLGVGMVLGWFTSPALMTTCLSLLALGAIVVWMLTGLVTAFRVENQPWLAAALERAHRPFLDRLNTLIFLRGERDPSLEAYAERIQAQTRDVITDRLPRSPFSPNRVLIHFALFVCVLAATIWFYASFHPWQCVIAASNSTELSRPDDAPFLEIPASEDPAAVAPEEALPWGEVRISEPGCDLRATTLDVIPLRIEAAANRPLRAVEWLTAVNGGSEDRNRLPPPDDPQYVVYDPEMPLRDYDVEAWDVLSYFARATSETGHNYDSDIYFVDLLPCRDELEEIPGGPDGPAYKLLEQLTRMIQRQQGVIRQTRRLQRSTDPSADDQKQYNPILAQEEADLCKTAHHLAAEATSRFESAVIDGLDEHFEGATSNLKSAAQSLLDDELSEAETRQWAALAEFVATRKDFYKLIREHPDAFRHLDNNRLAQRQQQMESRQQQSQSARELIREMLLAERNLERQASPAKQETFPQLAETQRQLNRSLKEFVKDNPQSFSRCEEQRSSAQSAMLRAAESLETTSQTTRQDLRQAGDELQKLDDSLEQQQKNDRLAEAHELRRMLDQQIRALGQCQQHGASAGACLQLAQQAKSTTEQLKQMAEQEPTSQDFGPQLRAALSGENKRQLDAMGDRLSQANNLDEGKQAAGELRKGLEAVREAFDASLPGMLAQQPNREELGASGQEAISRGMRQLESAARSQASGQPMPSQLQSRLGGEALANLEAGLPAVYGSNERSRQIIIELKRDLEDPAVPLDTKMVRELLRQIDELRREVANDFDQQADQAPTVHIDPSRFPPEYRSSIEKYFERLSKQ